MPVYKKLTAITVILATLMLCLLPTSANREAPLSPALQVIGQQIELCKSGLCGEIITFTPEDFDTMLGADHVDAVVILSLPDESKGKLMLGELEVMVNQTVSRANLSALRFIPADDGEITCGFRFQVKDADYDVNCNLFLLPTVNQAPIPSADDTPCLMETYRNIAVFGQLSAVDPEGDALHYEIVSYPKKGLLTLSDKTTGQYYYTPITNYAGRDHFSYTAVDRYGNRSDEITVSLHISKSAHNTVFCDMIGNPAHRDAIFLNDLDIMTGIEQDGDAYFFPDNDMTQGAYLSAAMRAVGITDDADESISMASVIPTAYRYYVMQGLNLGLISTTDDSTPVAYNPQSSVTHAEAAYLLGKLMGASDDGDATPVIGYADDGQIPAWAKSAVSALCECGVLDHSGEFLPDKPLTRSEAAVMLAAVRRLR